MIERSPISPSPSGSPQASPDSTATKPTSIISSAIILARSPATIRRCSSIRTTPWLTTIAAAPGSRWDRSPPPKRISTGRGNTGWRIPAALANRRSSACDRASAPILDLFDQRSRRHGGGESGGGSRRLILLREGFSESQDQLFQLL